MKNIILLIILTLISGCAGNTKLAESDLPRASPSYIQWLESQSLLSDAKEYSKIVSNTALQFSFPSTKVNSSLLNQNADLWFDLDLYNLITIGKQSAYSELANNEIINSLKRIGFNGLLLSNSLESGNIWSYERKISENGNDSISFRLAKDIGTYEQYLDLYDLCKLNNLQLGADLIPAATGLGADFMLATRKNLEHSGTYYLVEIAKEYWGILPEISSEWQVESLNLEQKEELAKLGIIPNHLSKDFIPFTNSAFWAATAEISGEDGNKRRFVYRYHENPYRPVLNLDDPSQIAKKILSASVIKEIGVERKSLVSLSLEALFGLDSTDNSQIQSFEPAISTIKMLNREIRRYGAFSLYQENIPLALVPALLDLGIDFVPDAMMSPSLELALISQDLEPLRAAIDLTLKNAIDQSRLWRSLTGSSLNSDSAINFALLPEIMSQADHKLANQSLNMLISQLPSNFRVHGSKVYASIADLAMLIASNNSQDNNPENIKKAQKIVEMTASIQGAIPGILALSATDILGLSKVDSSQTAFALSTQAKQSMTNTGLARANSLFEPLKLQIADHNSFANYLNKIAKMRQLTQISTGKMLERPKNSQAQVLTLVSQTTNGDYVLVAANFSNQTLKDNAVLKDIKIRSVYDLLNEVTINDFTSNSIKFSLEAWQAKVFLIK